MSPEEKSPVIDEYLGRVRSHLPIRVGGDIVRELESSIRDRVEDLAAAERREPDDEIVRRALAEIGDPEDVAVAYAGQRFLVGPADFRAFVAATAVVFALHIALIGLATTLGRAFQFGPFAVGPIGPHGIVSTAASVLQALLLDVGLMALVFAGTRGLRRRIAGASQTPHVDVSRRGSTGRIVLSLLIALVLNVFADKVFVVAVGNVTYPLLTEWFRALLPLVDAVIAVAVVSDALYLWRGETRVTLAVDALHGIAGLICMLFLLRGDALMALPAIEVFANIHGPLNDFLARLGELFVGFLALVLAVKTVRRLIRVAHI
jgi:hypothetical protein